MALRWSVGIGLVLAAVGCAQGSTPAPPGSAAGSATGSASTPGSVSASVPQAGLPPVGRIAFSAGAPHAEDIYVVNLDGSGLQRLTSDPAAEFDPAWSPDATQIAYRHQSGDDDTTEIYVMNADGSHAHAITDNDVPDWGPGWTPDGDVSWNSGLDVVGGGFHLWVSSADGSVQHALGTVVVEYPAWSPDGSRVAYMAQEPGASGSNPDYNIWVMNADETEARRLTDTPGSDGWPAWSPDGTMIVFASTRDDTGTSLGPVQHLYLMNADGSDQRLLIDTFGQFADWSPDGSAIVFSPDLNLVSPTGVSLGSIAVSGLGSEAEFADWAPLP
jgi:Tol biopolymer transport system component